MHPWTRIRCKVTLGIVLALANISNAQIFVDVNAPNSPHDGTNWRNAFLNLQDALDPNVASVGDEIWVADGVYVPTEPYCVDCVSPGARHATFRIPEGVAVYGGFHGVLDPMDPNDFGDTFFIQRDEIANRTILSGDVNGDSGDLYIDDDVYHVVTVHNANDDLERTKLSGFTIRYGNADADPNSALPIEYDRMGAGILVAGTRESTVDIPSSINVTRCRIENCRAQLRGGGMAVTWTAIPPDPSSLRHGG